jgi:hypothetical protein
LINQRQGGRRRGRGGQRGQNLGGQPGNRQDNRQRGNAAQLHEKYKSLARDAQLAGDRVQTEYYLQYADHYFRILSESRARFEDQRPRQRDDSDEDESEEMVEAAEADDEERQGRGDRGERFSRQNRDRDRDRDRRPFRQERSADEANDDDDRGSRVNGADDDSLPLDVLPPSIGADGPTSLSVEAEDEPAPRPRRRARAPKAAEGDDEVAPAA